MTTLRVVSALILVLAIGVALVMRITGAAGGDNSDPTGLIDRSDPRFWLGGLFYANRDDPALLVPKRYGIGWTINFGNPKSWIVLAAIMAVMAVSAVIAAINGPR